MTARAKLPAGFQIEKAPTQSAAHAKLPAGFQIEQEQTAHEDAGIGDLVQNSTPFSDEITGGLIGGTRALIGAGGDLLNGHLPDSLGEDFSSGYDDTVNRMRGRVKSARKKYGYVPEVIGGFVTGGGIAKGALSGAVKLGNAGREMVKQGMIWGGLSAAGEAEGGLQERGVAGVKGMLAGAVVGKGLHIGGKAVAKAAPYIGKAAKRVGIKRTTDDHLLRGLDRSQLTPDQALQNYDRGRLSTHFTNPASANPQRAELPEMIADMGQGTRRLGRAVATHNGPASQIASDALHGRSAGQYERVSDDLGRSLQVKSKDFHDEVEGVLAKRKTDSNQAYSAAYEGQQGFDTSAIFQKYADEIALHPAGSPARRKLDKALSMFRDVAENGNDLRRFDLAKQNLDDLIGKAKRSGAGNLTRMLTRMKHDLVDRADAANPLYGKARAIYSDASGMADAANDGRAFMRGDSDLTERSFGRLGKPEQDMYRLGVAQEMKKRLGGKRRGQDMTTDFDRPNMEKLFEVTARQRGGSGPKWTGGSPRWRKEHFDDLIQRERGFNQTKNTVLGGSPTAEKLADSADFTSNTLAGMVRSRGGISQGVQDFAVMKIGHLFEVREKEAVAVAKILFETDPKIIRATLRRLSKIIRPTKFARLKKYIIAERKALDKVNGVFGPGLSSAAGRDQGRQ